jgi:ERCC4-type nuclease
LATAPERFGAGDGIYLMVDNRELARAGAARGDMAALLAALRRHGVRHALARLAVADYVYVAQRTAAPHGPQLFFCERLIERKRIDDLAKSMADGRFERQRAAMAACRATGAQSLTLLIEGAVHAQAHRDTLAAQGLTATDLEAALRGARADGFDVRRVRDIDDAALFFAQEAHELQASFDAAPDAVCQIPFGVFAAAAAAAQRGAAGAVPEALRPVAGGVGAVARKRVAEAVQTASRAKRAAVVVVVSDEE